MIREVSYDTTINLQSMNPLPKVPVASPFRSHQLQPGHLTPVIHHQEHADWIFGVLVFCFILLAWTLVYHFKRFTTILSSTYSKRYLSQLEREGNILHERISVSLTTVYIISISLLIHQFNVIYFHWSNPYINGFTLFLLILTGVSLFWFFKIIVMNILGVIFRTQQSNHEYLVNIILFSTLSALCILPFLILGIYLNSNTLLFICLIFIALLFIIRFFKGMFIGVSLTRFSYLFLFVYLCALELLPLVVIVKLIMLYNTI